MPNYRVYVQRLMTEVCTVTAKDKTEAEKAAIENKERKVQLIPGPAIVVAVLEVR